MVKGLAKLGNRLRHGRKTKHVDAGPLQEGRLLPNDGRHSSQERRGGRSPRDSMVRHAQLQRCAGALTPYSLCKWLSAPGPGTTQATPLPELLRFIMKNWMATAVVGSKVMLLPG